MNPYDKPDIKRKMAETTVSKYVDYLEKKILMYEQVLKQYAKKENWAGNTLNLLYSENTHDLWLPKEHGYKQAEAVLDKDIL